MTDAHPGAQVQDGGPNVADENLDDTAPGGAAKIVLWRHGQTDHNKGLRLQGQVDIPLNATGREQARASADELAGELLAHGPRAIRIVSSDLLRARDTARALGARLDVDVEVDEGLRERAFGLWEGLTHEEIRADWPERYEAWRAGEDPGVEGAEARGDCAVRVGSAVARLAADTAEGVTLVVVSHGAAVSLAVQHLLGLDPTVWSGMRGMDNCHWAELLPNARPFPDWVLATYNRGAAEAPSGVVPGRLTS